MSNTTLKTIICRTTKEFLEILRPSNDLWSPNPMSWIFRGQGDGRWNLIPSAFRKGVRLSYRDNSTKGPFPDPIEQAEYEWGLIYDFVWFSDEIGLQVPGNWRVFRDQKYIEQVREAINNMDWPLTDIIDTIALAQHHGVPTRLLDFTRNANYATFFALRQADLATDPDHIDDEAGPCVWAVHRRAINPHIPEFKNRVSEIAVPFRDNGFLYAQKGLFLLDTEANTNWAIGGGAAALEDLLVGTYEQTKNYPLNIKVENPVIKIILPRRFRIDALRMLRTERITLAHLMPTYDNIVHTLNYQIDRNLLVLR